MERSRKAGLIHNVSIAHNPVTAGRDENWKESISVSININSPILKCTFWYTNSSIFCPSILLLLQKLLLLNSDIYLRLSTLNNPLVLRQSRIFFLNWEWHSRCPLSGYDERKDGWRMIADEWCWMSEGIDGWQCSTTCLSSCRKGVRLLATL